MANRIVLFFVIAVCGLVTLTDAMTINFYVSNHIAGLLGAGASLALVAERTNQIKQFMRQFNKTMKEGADPKQYLSSLRPTSSQRIKGFLTGEIDQYGIALNIARQRKLI